MKKIMVVDDDVDVRDAIEDVLVDEGYEVVGAAHGGEALAHLRSSPPPAVILLDLMMPVMDGYAFLEERAKHAQLAAVPIIVITAGGREHVPGTQSLLRKPLDISTLLAAIGELA